MLVDPGRRLFGSPAKSRATIRSRNASPRQRCALGIRYALYTVAVVYALLGIFDRSQGDSGIFEFSIHALLAALLIHLSRYLNDWLILYDFNNNREVVQEKNIAVALVEGATYVASAYVVAAAFYDCESGLWLAVVWFLIGQLLLIALALLYRVIRQRCRCGTRRSQRQRSASPWGAFFSGGIACGAAISGPSGGWRHDILAVAFFLSLWLAFIGVTHFLTELLVFRSSRLSDEVMRQQNIAAALFKAVLFLAVTLGYTHG